MNEVVTKTAQTHARCKVTDRNILSRTDTGGGKAEISK